MRHVPIPSRGKACIGATRARYTARASTPYWGFIRWDFAAILFRALR
jgi:hypothetical protein